MSSGTPSTTTPPRDSSHSQSIQLSLEHAMKTADTIRRHFREDEAVANKLIGTSLPPGTMEGLAGFVITGVALLPARRLFLNRHNDHPAFRNFLDLVLSVGHLLAATQVGLLTGSLYGCRTYLDAFSKIPPTAKSKVADDICKDVLGNVLPHGASQRVGYVAETDHKVWNPQELTMASLNQALDSCRQRQRDNST